MRERVTVCRSVHEGRGISKQDHLSLWFAVIYCVTLTPVCVSDLNTLIVLCSFFKKVVPDWLGCCFRSKQHF